MLITRAGHTQGRHGFVSRHLCHQRGGTEGQCCGGGPLSRGRIHGRNPWYLCTVAAAEQLYEALFQWERLGSITVDEISLAFFKDLALDIAAGKFAADSQTYKNLTSAVKVYADGYLSVAQLHATNEGALSEQYSRDNGFALSAPDLTWSCKSLPQKARISCSIPTTPSRRSSSISLLTSSLQMRPFSRLSIAAQVLFRHPGLHLPQVRTCRQSVRPARLRGRTLHRLIRCEGVLIVRLPCRAKSEYSEADRLLRCRWK